MKKRVFLISVLSLFLACNVAYSQEGEKKAKWRYLTEIYLMFPTMAGEVGVADIPPVELDADAATIFGQLKMGAMLYLEATNDDWSISSDLIYMKLGQNVAASTVVESGEVTMKHRHFWTSSQTWF